MSPGIDLKLDELKKALHRLKEALAVPKSDIVRDSVIQRFEFTVELSWKVLQRHLKSSGVVESLTPKNVFREAAKLGIVKDPEAWIKFVDARNLSSHTYKESLAEEVYASALLLPPYAEELVQAIERTV
jgi:nucleotidyltransferase substrate binding protein (TIGR01987 family)